MLNTIIEKTIGSVLFTVGDLAKFRMVSSAFGLAPSPISPHISAVVGST